MAQSKTYSFEVEKNEDDEITPPANPLAILEKLWIVFGEYFGTTLLVYIACMGCTGMQSELSQLTTSLNAGLAVMAVIHIFGHVSGAHVNPAVSIAALIMDQITVIELPIYVASQLAGSLTAYALLMLTTPKQLLNISNERGNCITYPNSNLSGLQAMAIEMLLTSILVLAVCSTWDRKNYNKLDSVALRIGLVVAMLCISGGAYTGASMNPARSFGPAVFHQDYDMHLVYWVGPCLGGIITAYGYKKLLLREK